MGCWGGEGWEEVLGFGLQFGVPSVGSGFPVCGVWGFRVWGVGLG